MFAYFRGFVVPRCDGNDSNHEHSISRDRCPTSPVHPSSTMDRVVGLIDMDCFYAQVEQRERPELWNTPVVVVQHAGEGTPGGVLAVSYEARPFGVKRGMMIPEAKAKCPDLNICFVPQGEHIDKADIQKYRDASAEVFDVLNSFDDRIVVERASVDEAFLDLTEMVDQKIVEFGAQSLLNDLLSNVSSALPTTHLADGTDKNDDEKYDRESRIRDWLRVHCAKDVSNLRLAIAAHTIEQMRAAIREGTQFFCSAGVANNKMLAKLVCSRHKPRQQTVLPFEFVNAIFVETPIDEVRMLGGKLGHAIQNRFAIKTMADLAEIPSEIIELHFEGQAQWIHQLAKGHDNEPVKRRDSQLSIAVSKNFPGKNALKTTAEVRSGLKDCRKNFRNALLLIKLRINELQKNVVFGILGETRTTRTLKIPSYKPQAIAEIIWGAAKAYNRAPSGSEEWTPPIFNLSMSASRFVEGVNVQSQSIMEWVEKRLELSESGSSIFSPSKTPLLKPRVFVKGVLKEDADTGSGPSSNTPTAYNTPEKKPVAVSNPEPHAEMSVDDDGWQIYDPAQFDTAVTPTKVPADVDFADSGPIPSMAFQELPADIREELAHFHKLDQARRLKEATSEREKKKNSSKKRLAATAVKDSPTKKKKIDSFFRKE
ncbi:hypothetical protein KIN20_020102 [Parelaphostrongylus tenuis]|uniref:UmuC domain-containing protein n=1 Tax=Parelaphostrongylus tenuis TaxID=148309 RepID=A0AAD5N3R0_PARTN|nr:hypothetical protein KIN20_020102 [Parelaphostrongylus tenuis]